MNKLKSLRYYLLNSNFPKKLQSENITTMTKGGKLISYYRRPGEGGKAPHNQKFCFEYTAVVLIMDYIYSEATLFYLLTRWLDKHIPNHPANMISIDIEQLNHTSADILIEITGLKDVYNPREDADGISIANCQTQEIDEIIGIWDNKSKINAKQDLSGPYAKP